MTTSVAFLFQFPYSLVSRYIHCFYWATLTLSVINDNLPSPTNTLEFAFTSVNYLFGVFVVAIIIGEVRNYGVTCIKSIFVTILIYCAMCSSETQQYGHSCVKVILILIVP